MSIKNLNIGKKIYLLASILILIFTISLVWLYNGYSEQLYKGRQQQLTAGVETAWGIIDHYSKMVGEEMSQSEAQMYAKSAIKSLRFEGDIYFWINDSEPKMIMHPIKPALDGKNLSASKDPTGKHLFVEFVNVCRTQGGGFVNYLWPKPGFDEPVEKISYVKRLAAWDWIIGNGLYVDDVEMTLGTIRTDVMVTILVVLLITGILVWLVNRSIIGPIQSIRRAINDLGKGKTDIDVDCGKPVNCSQAKNCNEPDCPSYGREDICWVTAGSFSTDAKCPRAQRGEDCNTCELYGPKNQMQELGSTLQGLANAMKLRANLARQIADGDLTQEIAIASDHDDLGMALVKMHLNLKQILCQLLQTANQIDAGSAGIEETSRSLTDGATKQAASIEEINSSVALMADQTRQNADNAKQANSLANQAKESAEKGNQQMDTLVQAMAEINESGQSISKIIKVIDEIAFQTNLLALNAAVEAARAGQHGKGFAVVAEEVRNLAARSAKAAQETAELIEGSVAKAKNGAGLADTTAAALTEIVDDITKATDLMGDISAASDDQAHSTDQINIGLTQIDSVGQENSAYAEESVATSEQLASQARHLNQLLGTFTLPQEECARYIGAVTPRPAESRQPAAMVINQSENSLPVARTTPGWDNLEDQPTEAPPRIVLDDDEFGKY
jgi:methyl-accepting chemotaxis protein